LISIAAVDIAVAENSYKNKNGKKTISYSSV
jgi:hypothetical protein